MFNALEIRNTILPGSPGLEVRVEDVHMEIEPSGHLIPTVHIDGRIGVRFPW